MTDAFPQESPPFRKLYAKMHVSLSFQDMIISCNKVVIQIYLQASLADATVHEFPRHLRDHLVMEAVSVARFHKITFPCKRHYCNCCKGRFSTPTTLRHNWLDDAHIIGQLLKPHLTNTIFINFAARRSLVAEEDSATQLMFSVFPSRYLPTHLDS